MLEDADTGAEKFLASLCLNSTPTTVNSYVLEILETLVEASYTKEKGSLLQKANLRLERVRYLLRLSKDLHLITIKQYEFASESLLSIGKEVGGWLKRQNSKQDAP